MSVATLIRSVLRGERGACPERFAANRSGAEIVPGKRMQTVETCASLIDPAVASGRAREPFRRCRPSARMHVTRLAAAALAALALPAGASAMVDGAAAVVGAPAARPAAGPPPKPVRPV